MTRGLLVLGLVLFALAMNSKGASDPLAGTYVSYTSDPTTLGYCLDETNGVCTSMCCVVRASFSTQHILYFYFDASTLTRCSASANQYQAEMQITSVVDDGNGRTTVNAASSTTVLNLQNVTAVFYVTDGVSQGLDITIGSTIPPCTIEEDPNANSITTGSANTGTTSDARVVSPVLVLVALMGLSMASVSGVT